MSRCHHNYKQVTANVNQISPLKRFPFPIYFGHFQNDAGFLFPDFCLRISLDLDSCLELLWFVPHTEVQKTRRKTQITKTDIIFLIKTKLCNFNFFVICFYRMLFYVGYALGAQFRTTMFLYTGIWMILILALHYII